MKYINMKLKDLCEVNFQNVDVYEPSGLSTSYVDPEKLRMDRAGRRDEEGRTKKLRSRFRFIKRMRSPREDRAEIKTDNTYDTHGVLSGPMKH